MLHHFLNRHNVYVFTQQSSCERSTKVMRRGVKMHGGWVFIHHFSHVILHDCAESTRINPLIGGYPSALANTTEQGTVVVG